MNVVSFGAGTNSTALLIGLWERRESVDYILFADTGAEKPHTYAHIEKFSKWLVKRGYPEIDYIKGQQPQQVIDGGLEAECLRLNCLPSVAYGFKSCSMKWKAKPQENFLKSLGITDYTFLIGFDADEPHRAKSNPKNRYPLIEWGWGREECIAAIDRTRVGRPGKSSCFFCPSSKKHEIIELHRQYPELAARAIAMEKNADLTSIKGLGRKFSWADVIAADEAQLKMIPETPIEAECNCYEEAA